jgi:hypothetical protein
MSSSGSSGEKADRVGQYVGGKMVSRLTQGSNGSSREKADRAGQYVGGKMVSRLTQSSSGSSGDFMNATWLTNQFQSRTKVAYNTLMLIQVKLGSLKFLDGLDPGMH